MITTTNTRTSRRFVKRLAAVGVGATLLATGAIGAQTFANGGGDETLEPEPPPGQPVRPVEQTEPDVVSGDNNLVVTNSTEYDPTPLTKFIPGSAFIAMQSENFGFNDAVDTIPNDRACLAPGATVPGNTLTELRAPVELPDGSRIKQIRWYGTDNSAPDSVRVKLIRENTSFGVIGGTWSQSSVVVDDFTTAGVTGVDVVAGADNLEERAGTPTEPGLNLFFPHNFHTVYVEMDNGEAQELCGVEVDYQIPVSTADPGTVFHPVEPFRAFDSRQGAFAESGRLAPNDTKVINITDGYDSSGVAIPAQDNLVPATATAITYNITVAGQTGPNFVAVTAGDAASFTASTINYTGGGNLANGASVEIDGAQSIKLWGGGNTGSAHVIIDVTGYYAPAPPPPNMGN